MYYNYIAIVRFIKEIWLFNFGILFFVCIILRSFLWIKSFFFITSAERGYTSLMVSIKTNRDLVKLSDKIESWVTFKVIICFNTCIQAGENIIKCVSVFLP